MEYQLCIMSGDWQDAQTEIDADGGWNTPTVLTFLKSFWDWYNHKNDIDPESMAYLDDDKHPLSSNSQPALQWLLECDGGNRT